VRSNISEAKAFQSGIAPLVIVLHQMSIGMPNFVQLRESKASLYALPHTDGKPAIDEEAADINNLTTAN
jgi:hypothetical protein